MCVCSLKKKVAHGSVLCVVYDDYGATWQCQSLAGLIVFACHLIKLPRLLGWYEAIWGSIKILFFSFDFVDNCDNNELVFQIIDCICWVDLNGYNSTSSQKYKYNFIIYYHEHDSRMTFNSPINWSFLQCLFGFSTVLFAFSFSVPPWKTHKTQKEPKKSRNNNNPISTLFIE